VWYVSDQFVRLTKTAFGANIAYAMSDQLNPQTNKPSKLEEFKLFYEAVPAPGYLAKTPLEADKKGPALRDRRLSRRRK
jgi:hypothetical protein